MSNEFSQAITHRSNSVSDPLTVIIPAGGKGEQMYPLSSGMPTTLMPLNDAPLLVHILRNLDPEFFSNAIITCSSSKQKKIIESYVDAFAGIPYGGRDEGIAIPIDYEQDLGHEKKTAVQLRELRTKLGFSGPFLLHYCDVLIANPDWKTIIKGFRNDPDKRNYLLGSKSYHYSVGIIERAEDSNNTRVCGFSQTPGKIISNGFYANCAVGLFTEDFIDNYIIEPNVGGDVFDKPIEYATKANKVAIHVVKNWKHYQTLADWIETQRQYLPEN